MEADRGTGKWETEREREWVCYFSDSFFFLPLKRTRTGNNVLSTFLVELPSQTVHRNLVLGVTMLHERDNSTPQLRRRRWRLLDRRSGDGAGIDGMNATVATSAV